MPGPNDVVNGAPVGVLSEDLAAAARQAIEIPRQSCRDHALEFSWARCAQQFRDNLVPTTI